jgi:hypothetical protein
MWRRFSVRLEIAIFIVSLALASGLIVTAFTVTIGLSTADAPITLKP